MSCCIWSAKTLSTSSRNGAHKWLTNEQRGKGMEREYQCDRCGKQMEYDEVAYLGSDEEGCSPFMKLECLCFDCLRKKENEQATTH